MCGVPWPSWVQLSCGSCGLGKVWGQCDWRWGGECWTSRLGVCSKIMLSLFALCRLPSVWSYFLEARDLLHPWPQILHIVVLQMWLYTSRKLCLPHGSLSSSYLPAFSCHWFSSACYWGSTSLSWWGYILHSEVNVIFYTLSFGTDVISIMYI